MMKNAILELTKIVQGVALIDSPADQVKKIVSSISQTIGADVCSLYRLNDAKDMVLLASHGLASDKNITIPAGKGLVGVVAQSRHSLNIADAANHPDYFYVEETQEEAFSSFCGVPLVKQGRVIGVLVVQSRSAEQLSAESEAFLVTLASQLALIVGDIPLVTILDDSINHRVIGVRGAPGIGIGVAKFCDAGSLSRASDEGCNDPEAVIIEWRNLLIKVQAEIGAEKSALGTQLSESVSGIFDAYQLLLSDQSLIDRVEGEIRAGHGLAYSLKISIQYFCDLFRAMDDPYLKARYEDIQHLGNKLFNVWSGAKVNAAPAVPITEPVVLVGAQVSVSDIASIPAKYLAGVVCYEGARLSHTAVLSNAIGIPAVMGVGTLKKLHANDQLVVDGNEGQIIQRPSEAVVAEFRRLIVKEKSLSLQLKELRDLPAMTTDGQTVRLLTNTGLLADITPGLKSGAEGIGLYRTEIPFMVRESFPTEDEQVQVYRKVFAAYPGRPVYMRTLDIGGDKQLPYFPITGEENPALGWRGIRFSLDNVQLLMTQVRAMIRAADGKDNLHVLLPMVCSTDEVTLFSVLLDDACAQLISEGMEVSRPKMGVMIEVPAAISMLPFWQDKIDFISIGSNDLSQYLLAMDRNNARVSKRYDHVHPAVIHEIFRIVQSASTVGLPVSVCGEMAADPVAVILLIGMGVRSLSLSSAKLPKIKWMIRSLSVDQARRVLSKALTYDDVERIRQLGNKTLISIGLEELAH